MRVRGIADYVRGVAATPQPRKGSDSPRLDEMEFRRRFRSQFQDQAFEPIAAELERVADAAWDASGTSAEVTPAAGATSAERSRTVHLQTKEPAASGFPPR